MIESYALMVMVMGTFFIYFCGMVWAFCNPKLSGSEEECETENQAEELTGLYLPAPLHTADGLTQTTYVNFMDDTDSLLSDCTAFCQEDHGIDIQFGDIFKEWQRLIGPENDCFYILCLNKKTQKSISKLKCL